MIYELEHGMRSVSFQEIDSATPVVGYITYKELLEYNEQIFHFADTTLRVCGDDNDCFRSTIDQYDDYTFGVINIVDVEHILGAHDRIGFYVKKNMFLMVDIIDDDNSTSGIFQYAVDKFRDQPVTIERMMFTVFERMIHRDTKALELFEMKISEMEEALNNGSVSKHFNSRILRLKREMLTLRSYYEQLIDISEVLQEDENGLFDKKAHKYFKVFSDRVTRLSGDSQLLRDSLVQLREAYQAQLDYEQNRIMKVFTVVTTVFLPLTLITSWYGMNFKYMPELYWEFGYALVALMCAVVAVLCIVFFKRKKLM